jgi:hypothetical protein
MGMLLNFPWTDLTRQPLCGNEQLVQKGTKNIVIVDDISDSSVQEYPSESFCFFFVFNLVLPVKQISQHVSHEARFNLEEPRQTIWMMLGLVPVPLPVVYHCQHSESSCKIQF